MDSFEKEPHNPIVTIEDQGKWLEMTDTELETMFSGLMNYLNENGEEDNLDWSRLNFKVYDAQYYRDKFGDGFPDDWYEIMANATLEDNRVQDFRQHSLSIEQTPTVLKFD
jgi:hypothetical protein